MYLSRFKLDVRNKHTQIALVSPNKIHGAIEDAFPKVADRSVANRNLWRIDRWNGETYLLLLSVEKPNSARIVGQFCKGIDDVETKNYNVLLDRVDGGSVWRFRLVANPTKSQKNNGQRGKVVAHITPKYQMEWLKKQAENHGFDILPESTSVVAYGWKIFRKRNGQEIRMMEAQYEGILTVRDKEKFIRAMTCGIGREKAYGMGLLTIMGEV